LAINLKLFAWLFFEVQIAQTQIAFEMRNANYATLKKS